MDTLLLEQIHMFDPPKPKRVRKERTRVGRVLMLGGGRQSSGLVERSVEGEGLDTLYDLVLFADTKDEPEYVYEQVAYLKTRLALVGTPLVTVRHKSGLGLMETIRDLANSRYAKMPFYVPDPEKGSKQLARQCSKAFKVDPCDEYLRKWLIERGHGKYNKLGAARDRSRVLEAIAVIHNPQPFLLPLAS